MLTSPLHRDAKECPNRVEVLWRTLVADTYKGEHPAPSECGEQFMAQVFSVMAQRLRKKKKKGGIPGGFSMCSHGKDVFVRVSKRLSRA
jgi:hypothetical protein